MESYFQDKKVCLYRADISDVLDFFDENYFDAVFTDPPYGLGFKGHKWDENIPSQEIWEKALRAAKPGSHMLAFGAPRTYHRLSVYVEDAGWNIKDSLLWLYGGGFTKSNYISNNLQGEEAEEWKDYANLLKPAFEPILLCQKPLDGKYVDNVRKWGVGCLNIGGCRIGGRWPPNVLMDEESANMLDAQSGITKSNPNPYKERREDNSALQYSTGRVTNYTDTGGASRFFYVPRVSTKEKTCNRTIKNNHPTTKPVVLTKYLANLLLPPKRELGKRVIFIPYLGSGSEVIGCLESGWDKIVGVEKDAGYCSIAAKRIRYYQEDKRPEIFDGG